MIAGWVDATMSAVRALLLLLVCFCVASGVDRPRTCDPIRIEMCRGLGYNVTGMPNLVGHELQQDADLQLQTFTPLIQYGCSSQLRFFLCSVYAPMCTEKVPQPIGPCRPLCLNVKTRCQPVLQEFGFPWPTALDCNKFPPENNHEHMCMEGPEPKDHERGLPVSAPRGRGFPATHRVEDPPCSELKMSKSYFYVNATKRCVQRCNATVLFSMDNKNFAERWIAIWASLCFLSTLFTLLTFAVDSEPVHYPERAIVFLSLSYLAYSCAYFVRLLAGRESSSCELDLLVYEGLDNINCTLIFVLLYFWGMATAVWWVILALTWFLAAGMRWSNEAIERRGSSWFHVAAWGLPAAKTIAILVFRAVDADELTGMCYVGNQNRTNLLNLVIIPTVIYLVIGVLCLVAGLVSMCRSGSPRNFRQPQSRPLQQQQQLLQSASKSDKLEILMTRIGIFALLYTVPATCVLVANIYEYSSRDEWLNSKSSEQPNVEIFTLKIFMSLVVGLTTGLWIWSSKDTKATWRKLWRRLAIRKKQQHPLPGYHQPPLLTDKPKRPRTKSGNETAV